MRNKQELVYCNFIFGKCFNRFNQSMILKIKHISNEYKILLYRLEVIIVNHPKQNF